MKLNASLAQLVEQQSSKLNVAGSKPARGTTLSIALLACSVALTAPAWAAKPSHEKAVTHASKKGASATPSAAKRSHPLAVPAKAAKNSKAAKAPKGKHAAAASEARVVPETAPVQPVVVLQKPPVPVRNEMGCSDQSGALLAVGQVFKSEGKAYRCQLTWDYAGSKLVGYPAWVEQFMPGPSLGAGLRETSPPPTTALVPPAPVTPTSATPEANPLAAPANSQPSPGSSNYLY